MRDRIVLCVSGPDAKSFLQNLVTNDVTKLKNNIIYSALLTPQGKLVTDFFLVDAGQNVLIDVNSKASDTLLKLLSFSNKLGLNVRSISSPRVLKYGIYNDEPSVSELLN